MLGLEVLRNIRGCSVMYSIVLLVALMNAIISFWTSVLEDTL
jgi:hypothetical protein